tara:strand:+ start:258 stop:479 length:222 start_codon:yes stop_codon:yes gene_type:complete
MKIILIMFLCSYIEGNACKVIETPIVEFKDFHSCSIHGYEYSANLFNNINKDFVNQYKAYTKFTCQEITETTT